MCLSRSAVREHERLEPGVEDERRHGVDELRLEQLDGRDLGQQDRQEFRSRRSTCWRSWSSWPSGKRWPCSDASSGRRRTCESSAELAAASRPQPAARARAPSTGACRSGAAPWSAPSSRCTSGASETPPRARLQHVPVELGRPAHGLAGVVDDVVEPVVGREQVVAERLDARRVAQIEAVDLEPVPPVGEVGLLRVAGGESRGKRVVTIRWAPARSSLIPAW